MTNNLSTEKKVLIQTKNLCYKAGQRYLLDHVNWTVREGEHWVVFGMNGSGKTTLLSAIAGYLSPSSGDLTVLGEQYNEKNIFALRKKVGWVSSSFFDRYYRGESALNVVLAGMTGTFHVDETVTDADRLRAFRILKELRVVDKMYRPFASLSKGERQNFLIARALLPAPEILVLDEPGTGLDIYAREHMMNTVKTLAESGNVTVLYVTHYPEEIQPFMNKTLLIRNGRVYANGDTGEIMTAEKLTGLLQEPVHLSYHQDGTMRMQMCANSHLEEICYGNSGGGLHD